MLSALVGVLISSSRAMASNARLSLDVWMGQAGESCGKACGALLPTHICAPPGEVPMPGGAAGWLPGLATPDEMAAMAFPARGLTAVPNSVRICRDCGFGGFCGSTHPP